MIELLAVVALIGTMATVGIVSFASSRSSTRVFAAVRDVMAMVRRARSVALVTHMPAVLVYSNVSSGDETMIKVEIKAKKLFSSTDSSKPVYTLSGEKVSMSSAEDSDNAVETLDGVHSPDSLYDAGETLEDVLSPNSLSREVAKSLKIKVLKGDEELQSSSSAPRARSRISIYSTVDNISRTYSAGTDEKAGSADGEENAETDDGPVEIVFSENGTVEPPHRIWIYIDGTSPDEGYCIEVDRFGEPKCREVE